MTRRAELQLEQVYSRGLGPYFVSGTNHQTVVNGRAPRHRGVLMGRVQRLLPESVVIEPAAAQAITPLKPGDGLVFDAAAWRSPEQAEEGGRIYEIRAIQQGQIELRFGNGAINFARIRPGDLVWRTHDPELDKVARPFTQAATPVHKQPVRIHVTAGSNAPLTLRWTLVEQPSVTVTVVSEQPLGSAHNRAMTVDYLREQLGRLGNTPYALTTVELEIAGEPFAPTSLLNHLRRQAVEQLQAHQGHGRNLEIRDSQTTLDIALRQVDRSASWSSNHDSVPQLHLLVRTPEQCDAAIALQPASITLDYLDLYGLRPSVERIQASGSIARVASPRVLKPNEQPIVHFLLRLECPIVVRSSGLLAALQETGHPLLIGDFSLNAANVLSADLFLRLGLTRFTPTYDLNARQVSDLARNIGADKLEVVAYQHLPVFHTEHCVFCRFLSTGTSYKDCGHPCEQHRLALRDVNGRAHPVMADVGCRNTVFGAEAQEASQYLDSWRKVGIHHFRLEFVHESAEEVMQITRAFGEMLAGKGSVSTLRRHLQRYVPQGITQGSLFIPENQQEIHLFA